MIFHSTQSISYETVRNKHSLKHVCWQLRSIDKFQPIRMTFHRQNETRQDEGKLKARRQSCSRQPCNTHGCTRSVGLQCSSGDVPSTHLRLWLKPPWTAELMAATTGANTRNHSMAHSRVPCGPTVWCSATKQVWEQGGQVLQGS